MSRTMSSNLRHRCEVLGRAPRDQPGAVAAPSESERQRLEPELVQPREH